MRRVLAVATIETGDIVAVSDEDFEILRHGRRRIITPPSSPLIVPPQNHPGTLLWGRLHSYGLEDHAPDRRRAWFGQWCRLVDQMAGCKCGHHWRDYLRTHPPDFRHFFAWGVHAHNAVNLRLGKPVISLDAARRIWSR